MHETIASIGRYDRDNEGAGSGGTGRGPIGSEAQVLLAVAAHEAIPQLPLGGSSHGDRGLAVHERASLSTAWMWLDQ